MTTNRTRRPALTLDSLAAAMIADLYASSLADPAAYRDARDAFDADHFADIMIDECTDDDTTMIFDDPDAALALIDNADLRDMLITAITNLDSLLKGN